MRLLFVFCACLVLGSVNAQNAGSVSVAPDSAAIDSIFAHLSEVEVVAMRPLIKTEIDRLSYDVQADGDSKTSTAIDMLRKVPLVSVDGEDNIRVRGNSNFKIYKNGHPDPSLSSNPKEVLKALPASMIKRIEVITEPGAKYDAEGVAAILNIVTVSSNTLKGVTGTLRAGVSETGNPNASAYVTTQVGKWVTSVNYGWNHRGYRAGTQRSHQLHHYVATGDDRGYESSNRSKVGVHYGNIESSFEPDTLNLLTLSLGGYYYNFKVNPALSWVTMRNAAGEMLYRYVSRSLLPNNDYLNLDGRFDFQHKTHRKGEALTLSYMLSTSSGNDEMRSQYLEEENAPMTYSGLNRDGHERFWEHTWQLDWTRPFLKYHTFETGLKYIHRSNRSKNHTDYVTDEGISPISDRDSHFKHLTQVGAAYASYTYRKEKWSARAGLRYEWSYLSAKFPDGSQSSFHRSLNDWVPSASVSYQIDMGRSLKAAFATRINRPGIAYLNPGVSESPTDLSYGNPNLNSSRNYSMSMTYMQVGRLLTFNVVPGYSWSSNGIGDVHFYRNGQDHYTYDNTLLHRWVGVSGFVQWNPVAKTSFMLNASAGRDYYRSKELGLKNARWGTNFYAQLTQQLPWQLRFTGSLGQWGGGAYNLYGYQGRAWFHSFALQRSFLKENRLTVRASAQNPFSGKYSHSTSHTTQGDYTGWQRYEYRQRSFQLSVSYRFGSLKAYVKKTDKTIENNDVVGGGQKGGESQQPMGGGK